MSVAKSSQCKTVRVALGDRSYNIHIGPGLLDRADDFIQQLGFGRQGVIVTDSNVGPLYGVRLQAALARGGMTTSVLTVPAGEPLGPRLPSGVNGLGGVALTRWLEQILAVVETTRTDAFPSGRVAIALVCLWFARRAPVAVRWVVGPLVAGIAFSTVYLHYHYVVDVVAGTALRSGVCGWAPASRL